MCFIPHVTAIAIFNNCNLSNSSRQRRSIKTPPKNIPRRFGVLPEFWARKPQLFVMGLGGKIHTHIYNYNRAKNCREILS